MMYFLQQFPGRRPPWAERERPVQGPSRQRVLPPDHRGGLQGRREVRQGRRLGHHQARLSQVPKQVSTEMENKKNFFTWKTGAYPENKFVEGSVLQIFRVFWLQDEGAFFEKKF